MPQAILLQDVESLGERGAVVDVSAGYLRNYLQPRKLAQPATSGSIAAAARQRERAESAERESEERAKENATLLGRTVLTIRQQAGEDGRLFGRSPPRTSPTRSATRAVFASTGARFISTNRSVTPVRTWSSSRPRTRRPPRSRRSSSPPSAPGRSPGWIDRPTRTAAPCGVRRGRPPDANLDSGPAPR